MKTEDTNKEDVLHVLRNAIERGVGYGLNTPYDFKQASAVIMAQTGRPISPTTLMRIWGYIRDGGENYHPSLYSLSTLAMFLGYFDIKDFAARYQEFAGKERNGMEKAKKIR